MPNVRVFAPATGNLVTTVSGRTYTGVLGTPQDVPDFDALELQANGWARLPGYVGATTDRAALTGMVVNDLYYDTTLSMMMVYDGANWRRASTGATT